MMPWYTLATGMRPRSATPTAPVYLDELAVAPRCVLSLRKKISTATNSIRVRRSSDNAEQDIGFTGDVLDTASLATFVGANSAFVVTFYDQTGNGEDATQATAGSQPRIVNAGVYDGKLVFDGSADFLKITSLTQGTAYVGLYAKWEQTTDAAVKVVVELSADYGANSQSFIVYEYSPQGGFVAASHNGGVPVRANGFDNSVTGLTQWSILYDRTVTGAGEVAAYRGGTGLTPTNNGSDEQTGTYTTYDLYIGARAGSSLYSSPKIETLVFYNADSSGVRSSIEGMVA